MCRAKVYGRQEEIDKAMADFDRALKLNSKLTLVYHVRGKLWLRTKTTRPSSI